MSDLRDYQDEDDYIGKYDIPFSMDKLDELNDDNDDVLSRSSSLRDPKVSQACDNEAGPSTLAPASKLTAENVANNARHVMTQRMLDAVDMYVDQNTAPMAQTPNEKKRADQIRALAKMAVTRASRYIESIETIYDPENTSFGDTIVLHDVIQDDGENDSRLPAKEVARVVRQVSETGRQFHLRYADHDKVMRLLDIYSNVNSHQSLRNHALGTHNDSQAQTEMQAREVTKRCLSICIEALWNRWMSPKLPFEDEIEYAKMQVVMGMDPNDDQVNKGTHTIYRSCCSVVAGVMAAMKEAGMVLTPSSLDDSSGITQYETTASQQNALDFMLHAILNKIFYTVSMLEDHEMRHQPTAISGTMMTLNVTRHFGTMLSTAEADKDDRRNRDYQQLLLHMVNEAHMHGLRKYKDQVYQEQKNAEGYHTRHFTPVCEIRAFVASRLDAKEYNYKIWNLATSHPDIRAKIIRGLSEIEDLEFPTVDPCRWMWSYENGIFDANTLNFLDYVRHRDMVAGDICTANYFRNTHFNSSHLGLYFRTVQTENIHIALQKLYQECETLEEFRNHRDDVVFGIMKSLGEEEFNHKYSHLNTPQKLRGAFLNEFFVDIGTLIEESEIENEEQEMETYKDVFCKKLGVSILQDAAVFDDWNDIPTDAFDTIPRSQNWSDGVTRELHRQMGRMKYPLGTHDQFHIAPYLFGLGGTGKTIVSETQEAQYDTSRIFKLQPDAQREFGWENALGAWLCLGTELAATNNFAITTLQQMISMESVTINRKGEKNVQIRWTTPVLAGGNMIVRGDKDAVVRRLLVFYFSQVVRKKDTNLKHNIMKEINALQVKDARAYMECVYGYDRNFMRLLFENQFGLVGMDDKPVDDAWYKDLRSRFLSEQFKGMRLLHMSGSPRLSIAKRKAYGAQYRHHRQAHGVPMTKDIWDIVPQEFKRNKTMISKRLSPVADFIHTHFQRAPEGVPAQVKYGEDPRFDVYCISVHQLNEMWKVYLDENTKLSKAERQMIDRTLDIVDIEKEFLEMDVLFYQTHGGYVSPVVTSLEYSHVPFQPLGQRLGTGQGMDGDGDVDAGGQWGLPSAGAKHGLATSVDEGEPSTKKQRVSACAYSSQHQ